MKKTKHNAPWKKKPEPNFIKFSQVQKNYLDEVLARTRREFNEAVESVYDEIGITEKILQAPFGKYKLRKDCSGLDILPVDEKNK